MILVQKLKHGDALHALLPGSFWIRGEDTVEARQAVLAQLRKSSARKVVAIVCALARLR